jgi:hypothetical protein
VKKPGKYSASVTVLRWQILSILAVKLDENGQPLLDNDGRYVTEVREIETKAGDTLFLTADFEVTGKVDPTPDPDPPDPPDPPTPDAPFPAPGLTVLTIAELSETGSLPKSQRAILDSPRIMQWCRDNCIQLSGMPAYRKCDDDYTDSQLANVPDVLSNAYKILLKDANGNLPWIGISDGKKGYSGPLPMTVDETITLLEKYN